MKKIIKESARDFYFMNYVNPLFWALLALLLVLAFITILFWRWLGVRKLYSLVKNEVFYHSKNCNTEWCRKAYRNISSFKNSKDTKEYKILMKRIVKIRYRLIKNTKL